MIAIRRDVRTLSEEIVPQTERIVALPAASPVH